MTKQMPYKYSICGAAVAAVPMQHQLSHAQRRPFAAHRVEPAATPDDDHQQPPTWSRLGSSSRLPARSSLIVLAMTSGRTILHWARNETMDSS